MAGDRLRAHRAVILARLTLDDMDAAARIHRAAFDERPTDGQRNDEKEPAVLYRWRRVTS